MEPTAKRSSQGMMCILLFVMITTLSISPSNALRCSIGFITPSSLDHIPAGTASCNPGNGERTCTLSSCHGSGPTGTMLCEKQTSSSLRSHNLTCSSSLVSSFVFHDCEDEFEKKKGLTIYPTSFDEANNELAVHGREHPTGNIGTYYCTMKSNPYRPCEFCFNHTEPFLKTHVFSTISL
ncbi:hypothetical protein PSHT_15082 [Puccinia striiformis]|uniref:Ig-like domain-containing protein n=1 Tax=Puccinia striiformis TaxID=27350 RepID=A0A2S4UH66_9BASI|nr:hypothetical protein PSHT_15082 [Puccinia striiformis]